MLKNPDVGLFWSRSQVSAFTTSYCESSMFCHGSLTPERSLSSRDPSWISPCDSSLRVSQSGAYYYRSHMCSQRACSDPTAQSNQGLPFTRYEIAETVSLNPEHSAVSSCFKKAEETGNAPGSEEGRGASEPCDNKKHEDDSFSRCPEKWKPFASENLFGDQLEQKEDSADWKTEREKLGKEEGDVFTPRVNDAQQSPANVICLGSQHRPVNAQDMMQHAQNALMHTNFDLGDTADNMDLTRMSAFNAGEEMERSSEETIDKGHLRSALHLIKKRHGAYSGESFVENIDSADLGKDQSMMLPEDANQSQHIGEYVMYVCGCRITCDN